MATVAKKYQDELKRIKKNVDYFRDYFRPNCDRFNESRKFIFDTSLDMMDLQLLSEIQKPQIEFNYGEAYLSRLIGEFSKQEPSITVSASDMVDVDPTTLDTIKFVDGYIRHILFKANNDSFEDAVYKDTLSGGFSAIRVWTDYCHDMSFNQDIYLGKCFSATLVGFDPLAQLAHKGDGNYCFELYPKRLEDFKREYDVPLENLKFGADINGYKWTYRNNKDKMVLVCDYYEKKKKRTKIVKLANNKVLTEKEYRDYLAQWMEDAPMEQPAAIIATRYTDITTIVRYRFIENQVLEYIETDYDELPIVFCDGNSIMLEETGQYRQMTRPYLYHAKGIQKLINFAGQSLAGELQNMVQHKWKVAVESINPAYKDAFRDNQVPNVILYNAFLEGNPLQPVPQPQEIVRQGCPPEIMQTFTGGASIFQNIMGTYDAALGIQNNELSGVALVEGATQSNAAAMPHVMGFLQALNQVAQIIIKLIPKYLVTPRTVPIMTADGKRSYIKINQSNGIKINYGPNDLQVKVEAGVNFNVQKTKTLLQISQMMQADPGFAQFIIQKGLKIIVQNMDIRGQDEMEVLADEYMKEYQAQQKQAQQMQMQQSQQPNPLMMKTQIEQQRLQLQAKQDQEDNKFRAAEILNAGQKIQNERLNLHLKAAQAGQEGDVQVKKADAEIYAKSADLAMKHQDMQHRHAKEAIEQDHQHTHDRARLGHDLLANMQDHELQKQQLENKNDAK